MLTEEYSLLSWSSKDAPNSIFFKITFFYPTGGCPFSFIYECTMPYSCISVLFEM